MTLAQMLMVWIELQQAAGDTTRDRAEAVRCAKRRLADREQYLSQQMWRIFRAF